jgi:hypothetical protein
VQVGGSQNPVIVLASLPFPSPEIAMQACDCPLGLDTPPGILADWMNEHGWTFADLQSWYLAVLLAFLEGGGWHTVPEAVPMEDASTDPSWEFELPGDDGPD